MVFTETLVSDHKRMNLKLQTVSSDNNAWMCKMSAFVYIVAEYSARGNKRNAQSVETHRMYYNSIYWRVQE